MATTTAKKTAKKTARKTSTRTSAKRTTTRSAPKKAAPINEREPKALLEDAGFAAAGFAHDVVELARTLPTRLDKLRVTDRDALLSQLTTLLDSKAAEGRKVAKDVQKDTRVKKILEQTGNTRSQVKAAATSVRKTADVSLLAGRNAGRKQAGNATSQVKAAVTSLRRSGATITDAAAETVQD
ncbi:MAG: hypothetical protein WD378_03550 [Egicoccus sp.]